MNDQQAIFVIERFLHDQPQWEAHTTWTILPNGQRTEPWIAPEGAAAFLWWQYEHALIERPSELPSMLDALRTADQEWQAHHAGICCPETCRFGH